MLAMGFNAVSLSHGLVLLCFTLGLAGEAAAAAGGRSGYASPDLATLASLLGQRGWQTEADTGGNLLISRTLSNVEADAVPDEVAAPPTPRLHTQELAELLPNYGWTVRRDTSGALTLLPPLVPDRSPSISTVVSQPVAEAALAGSTVQPDALGAGHSSPEAQGTGSDLVWGRHLASSRAVLAQPASDRLAALAEQLSQRGWVAERQGKGTLTLYPPAARPASHTVVVAVPCHGTTEPRVREALARRGWDLRRDAAGNVFLTRLV
jgi:hypothetical protein